MAGCRGARILACLDDRANSPLLIAATGWPRGGGPVATGAPERPHPGIGRKKDRPI
ncbi:hypothetical protein [Lichenicoccus sp.]|uniref:hypothetical protein n=1 Tax=Lichenicoccus sp. TaxID=2781899 RepID=UPI003D09DAAA